jgi:hypothetical protein
LRLDPEYVGWSDSVPEPDSKRFILEGFLMFKNDAATSADPSSSEATRAAVGVVFDAFNRHAGIGVGEHLGYLFTALWTFSIAIPLLQRSRLLGITR